MKAVLRQAVLIGTLVILFTTVAVIRPNFALAQQCDPSTSDAACSASLVGGQCITTSNLSSACTARLGSSAPGMYSCICPDSSSSTSTEPDNLIDTPLDDFRNSTNNSPTERTLDEINNSVVPTDIQQNADEWSNYMRTDEQEQVDPNSPLTKFNPLLITGSPKLDRFSTPGGIVSEILTGYAFPFAGMVLFVMVLWGGFEIMTSSIAGKKDAGRQRITTAIIGFILLFSSYWIAQLVQQIFGVQFL